MYSEWVSLRHALHASKGNKSVLNHFPQMVGRDVAHSVVQTLIHEQGMPEQKVLSTACEVDWAMEVFCYGLSLPMTEADGEIIKGCVNVYIEWLSVLSRSDPKKSIPDPLIQEPDKYSQKMFHHLRNLFKIRVGDGSNLAMQASLCIRVLQFLKCLTSDGELEPETWETLLCVLLSINEQLLSPPYSPGGLSQHLCDILINTLLEVWLHACVQHFPAPSMWKTLQELCMAWRHHNSMIEYWSSTSLSLTRKVIKYLYGTSFSLPTLDRRKNDVQVPLITNSDTLLQSWFRILHVIGNPVDLCNRELISDTPKFKEFALASEEVMNPSAHPCLDGLPQIFLHAMKGVAILVNNFLGITITQELPVKHTPISAPIKTSSPSVAKKRELRALSIGLALGLGDAKGIGMRSQTMPSRHSSGSTSVAHFPPLEDTTTSKGSQASSMFSKSPSSTNKPSVDSLLDLFGVWLFEAAFAKTDMKASYAALADFYENCCNSVIGGEELHTVPRRVSSDSNSSLSRRDLGDEESFEPGRAEAYGALCRIFCTQHSGQEIRPIYLSRFYLAIATGLLYNESCTGHVLCSILLNSPDLLRVNLQGVQILLPHLLAALEIVLPRRQIQLRCPVSVTELRRAAIHLLLSMLCLPLHFQNLQIQDMTGYFQKKASTQEGSTMPPPLTFLSLKPRMTRLLLEALQFESDSFNVQLLLGGILLLIQDSEIAESLGITSPDLGGGRQGNDWHIDAATRARARASTGGSSLDAGGSFSQLDNETETKLTFPRVSTASYDPSTVCGLFVQLTHLLCNKLVVTRSSKWKPDVHVTLAAFEVLSGLAQLNMEHLDQTECKSTIHWLCDYVTYQANKPATHHSRDLHSMIVASFHCIKTWIMSHPWLMDAEDCLQAVMEVVELGISGSKSKATTTVISEPGQERDEPKLKGDKELKPVSFRVRAAAESLLTCIMEHLGSFPPPCGPAAVSSLLNEESLLDYSRTNKGLDQNQRHFRYFVIRDNQVILGLLEDSLEAKDTLPTVTSIIRAPSGRHVWTMQLRHFSRKKHDLVEAHLEDPGRPPPCTHPPQVTDTVKHRHFPAAVDSVPQTKADRSIPELDDILDDKLCEVQDHMRTLMQKQAEHESVVQAKAEDDMAKLKFPSPDTESQPPKPCENFQASRLLLSHLGLLTLEGLEGSPSQSSFEGASLVALDSSRPGFQAALTDLDRLPTRTQDTVFVFYVKAGQHEADAILENEVSSCKHGKVFIEFLLSLGWPVDIDTHPGWTGNVEKAWAPERGHDVRPRPGRIGSGLGACSMSTITSSTSTMGRDGDITPSSDEEVNWFVRDRFETCRETPEGDVTREEPHHDVEAHQDSVEPTPTVRKLEMAKSESVDKELNQILYYANISGEVAFLVPALLPHYQRFRRMIVKAESSGDEAEEVEEPMVARRRARSGSMGSLEIKSSSASSLELRQPLARQASDGAAAFEGRGRLSDADSKPPPNKVSLHGTSPEVNVIVTWLEQFSDHGCLPVDDLLMEMDFGTSPAGLIDKDTVVIFITSLENGLYRVHIRSTIRSPIGGPLVDGMVVSRRALGAMVRQTAINIFHRRRLEIDSYSPPKVCRKLKIQDIVKKYRKEMSVPEFYVSLFGKEDQREQNT